MSGLIFGGVGSRSEKELKRKKKNDEISRFFALASLSQTTAKR